MEVLLDLFPCNLETPNGAHEKVRVIVADGRAHVFGSDHSGLHESLGADVVTVDQGGYWPYRLTTTDGQWVIDRASGCGCGHPLKRARQADLLALVAVP